MLNQDGQENKHRVDTSVRAAQELIAEIWALKSAANGSPARVIVNPEQYRILQQYRSLLGELPDPQHEYLQRYSLFNLEFCVDVHISRPRLKS